MKIKFTVLHIVLFFIFKITVAQDTLVKKWDYRYGGTSYDFLYEIHQTTDGGYIFGGTSSSAAGGDKTQVNRGNYDYWFVKTDSLGIKQWDKDFGGPSTEALYSFVQTTDGGYMLAGSSASGVGVDKTEPLKGGLDFWLIKLDSLGNKKWDRDIGGLAGNEAYKVQQTPDGGYILAGYSNSGIGGDKTTPAQGLGDIWVMKIDSAGNILWEKDYGGSKDDYANALQQTTDGGYIIGGFSESPADGNKSEASYGNRDYWVVKIDSLGNKQWDRDFGGTGEDVINSVQQTPDGGYLLGGHSASGISGNKTQALHGKSDYWIVKIDSLGNMQWDKDFGGSDKQDFFGNIFPTSDRGYLFTGTSYSSMSGDKTENNLGQAQAWIVKTDSLCNKQWDKTILSTGLDQWAYGLQTKEGCYVFAIMSPAGIGGYKTQNARGNFDHWIIKFCDSLFMPESNFVSPDTLICAVDSINCLNFTNLSSHTLSYEWHFPGATPASDTTANPTNICYSSPGTYSVTLKSFNNNGSDSLTKQDYIVIDNCLNATEPGNNEAIEVFPNPSANKFTISFNKPMSNAWLKIFDRMGKEVYRSLITDEQHIVSTKLNPGIYFMRVIDNEKEYVQKLIVE